MNMRRLRIIKYVASAVAVMVLAWCASAIAVYAVSSGRVFDSASIDAVPHQRAAVVMGCVRTLPNGLNNLYFSRRIDAAAELYKAGKVDCLDLRITTPVTFLVGENGSGKSTLLEALVDIAGLPVRGGGKGELADHGGESELAPYLRSGWTQRPGHGFFFRAEFEERFASLLDSRRDDRDFIGDPYSRYGGRSLHERSHGEAFLHMMRAWMYPGILFMDEPESALSPQKQLTLLTLIYDMVEDRDTQFVIATHSPILMTFPGATILSLDGGDIHEITLEETQHYQITKGILESPERYWRHLRG